MQLIKGWIPVSFFVTLATTALTYKNGVEFTNDLKCRKFTTILGKTFGTWETYPDIKYLSVVRVKQAKLRITGAFVDQEKSNKIVYQVNMIYANKKHKKLFSADNPNAIKYAIEIATFLNLQVLDFTTTGRKGLISTDKN